MNLFGVVAPETDMTNDDTVRSLSIMLTKLAKAQCALKAQSVGNVTLLPQRYEPHFHRGDTAYRPVLADAYLYGFDRESDKWVQRLRNYEREGAEKLARETEKDRKRAERKAQRDREIAASLARPVPVIRGVTLSQSWEAFLETVSPDAATWEPELKPNKALPLYRTFTQEVTLRDQATFAATFSSASHQHQLLRIVLEQRLKNGPSPDELRQQLNDRFGPPDQEAGQRNYLTWWLKSATGKSAKRIFESGRSSLIATQTRSISIGSS